MKFAAATVIAVAGSVCAVLVGVLNNPAGDLSGNRGIVAVVLLIIAGLTASSVAHAEDGADQEDTE